MGPDREALEKKQWRQLRALLDAVWDANSFYTAKLKLTGLDAPPSSRAEFLEAVPFTEKSELVADQTAHPPFGTNLTFPIERYSRFCQTSGTTARPMRWLDTPESWSWMLDSWTRVLVEAGVTAADRVFFPFSFGPFLGFWAAFEAASRMGCLTIPGGGMRSGPRVRTILENGVTALCATPTYAIHLAEVAAEEGLDLGASKVRRILVAGEPGGSIPTTRALIERRWPGARVYDHHGMTEMGPVSYECRERRGVLHVIEEAYLPEVIDPQSLEPVEPGAVGELVLTNLGRTGSPLLRYRTHDLVRTSVEQRCVCGSVEMALEGGILGRTDDMVVVRGVNIYPSAVEEIVRREPGVAEFRVEIGEERGLAECRLLIEAEGGEAVRARIEAAMRAAFALRVDVECVAPGTLPRFELKAKRWFRKS
jgi:phenylacetate-CoA ligase